MAGRLRLEIDERSRCLSWWDTVRSGRIQLGNFVIFGVFRLTLRLPLLLRMASEKRCFIGQDLSSRNVQTKKNPIQVTYCIAIVPNPDCGET